MCIVIISGQNFHWVKIAHCKDKISKIKISWAEIFPEKKNLMCNFSFNSGVDYIKLPVCDDTEDDDSLDIGSLG